MPTFLLEIENNIHPKTICSFLQRGKPEIEEILDGFPFLVSHRSAYFFGLFLVEFHRDRASEWRRMLYPTHPVLRRTASNNLSFYYSATILTHAIACSHKSFSETKYCYFRNEVRNQLVPFAATPSPNVPIASLRWPKRAMPPANEPQIVGTIWGKVKKCYGWKRDFLSAVPPDDKYVLVRQESDWYWEK